MGWSILDAGFTPNLVRIARRFTFVRNHAQRQVEALEIAAVAMTPYPHTHILRFEINFASRN